MNPKQSVEQKWKIVVLLMKLKTVVSWKMPDAIYLEYFYVFWKTLKFQRDETIV
jgi:hypothetical protein